MCFKYPLSPQAHGMGLHDQGVSDIVLHPPAWLKIHVLKPKLPSCELMTKVIPQTPAAHSEFLPPLDHTKW